MESEEKKEESQNINLNPIEENQIEEKQEQNNNNNESSNQNQSQSQPELKPIAQSEPQAQESKPIELNQQQQQPKDYKSTEEYKDILEYLNGELKSKSPLNLKDPLDISYNNWVVNDDNLKKLCTAFEIKKDDEANYVIKSNNKGDNEPLNFYTSVLRQHDHGCELKLLKWITDDNEHHVRFLKIQKNLTKLNRHGEILPYEFNAVSVNGQGEFYKGDQLSDNYINASYINGPFIKEGDEKLFIATQGPLPSTIYSFWSMILNHNVNTIIMLTSVEEEGRVKSEVYWPTLKGTPFIVKKNNIVNNNEGEGENKEEEKDKNKDIIIELESESDVIIKAIVLRNLIINGVKKIKHIQMICWPDHSVPGNVFGYDFVNFLIEQIDEDVDKKYNVPIVIHCSAGIGRTGTFIAIYNIVRCLKKLLALRKKYGSDVLPILNVFNVVRKLREQRFSMITDTLQYHFIYKFCLMWISKNFK